MAESFSMTAFVASCWPRLSPKAPVSRIGIRMAMVIPASACMAITRAASTCASAPAATAERDGLRELGMGELRKHSHERRDAEGDGVCRPQAGLATRGIPVLPPSFYVPRAEPAI